MLGRLLKDVVGIGAQAVKGTLGHPAAATTPESPGSPQVLSLGGVRHLVNARHGWFLAYRNDIYLGYALIRYGECSEIESRFLSSLVSRGDIVIEVGSNIGVHTVPLARSVGENGHVLAVEAQPAIYRMLCANLALNGLQHVSALSCGCGAGRGTMMVPPIDYEADAPQNHGGVSLASSGQGVPVAIHPLDELAADIPRLRLLKLDVEGMELEVLQGAETLIGKHRPWMYVENDRIEKSEALIRWLLEADYRIWWHVPPLFNPDNYFSVAENEYGQIISCNMLCVPREDPSDFPDLVQVTDSKFHPLSPVPGDF